MEGESVSMNKTSIKALKDQADKEKKNNNN